MSSRRPPLRVDVARIVDRFLGLMASEGGPKLRGLYLVGSVALGDFRPGRSDIDFVALLDGPADEAETEALARVHAALARAGGPHFDGLYLPIDAVRHPPEPDAVVPFSVDGQLRTGEPCREVNPSIWRCLSRTSRPILGAAPAALNIADDDARLHAYCRANLEAHWRPWLARHETALAGKTPDDTCDAAALEWGVLGVSRILCTLATGRIVSKREGGRFVLDHLPEAHQPAVWDALDARDGALERVSSAEMRAGLDTMRFLIDGAPRYQAGAHAPTSADR
ncbi:aminoglycoside adenylyltransferase domain-containing protein [Methylobacterium sp. R2-1]|uniref:aminoglycoside adenylyltransferase domain-containing protein n=1 Tax=Methylobacterium sp. R2-1 TaxID=2587064 RepID=UPI001622C82C|nr:aminoglycoside adenylyltransferase domain-containing protein [Methylobacterium sp. R2-1]MBB2960977.1 putative nucleotidyltransferase [Methylobacterium sp. R2-1]